MNKRKVGREKEQLACRFLIEKGYQIVTVNYWCQFAEIDIVARNRGTLVFIEVKYRSTDNCGGSRYAISAKKIRNISECARYYIYKERIPLDTPMRFDVIAIDGEVITHFENAFEYKER